MPRDQGFSFWPYDKRVLLVESLVALHFLGKGVKSLLVYMEEAHEGLNRYYRFWINIVNAWTYEIYLVFVQDNLLFVLGSREYCPSWYTFSSPLRCLEVPVVVGRPDFPVDEVCAVLPTFM